MQGASINMMASRNNAFSRPYDTTPANTIDTSGRGNASGNLGRSADRPSIVTNMQGLNDGTQGLMGQNTAGTKNNYSTTPPKRFAGISLGGGGGGGMGGFGNDLTPNTR